MNNIKTALSGTCLIIVAIVVCAIGLSFSIVDIVAVARCGPDCDSMLGEIYYELHGETGEGRGFYKSLLGYSITGLIVAVLNLLGSVPIVKKFAAIVIGVGYIVSLGLLIWFLVDNYKFWDGLGDILAAKNRTGFICAFYDLGDYNSCMKETMADHSGKGYRTYLMYYAAAITECLFYITCGFLVLSIIAYVILCSCSKKSMR